MKIVILTHFSKNLWSEEKFSREKNRERERENREREGARE